jgi:Ser/Thr protein kinase RdoA (MazF antagonist)
MHIAGPTSVPLQAATDGERTLAGYKAQCELLAEQLELLVAGCEARHQSLICEGERRRVVLETSGHLHNSSWRRSLCCPSAVI